jgi:hypothetical protein
LSFPGWTLTFAKSPIEGRRFLRLSLRNLRKENRIVYAQGKARSSTGESEAQDIALAALTWFAEDAERLEGFLSASGLGPQNLRAAATTPGFFGAILDYLAVNEPLLIAFATYVNRTPDEVMQAHQRLNARDAQHES